MSKKTRRQIGFVPQKVEEIKNENIPENENESEETLPEVIEAKRPAIMNLVKPELTEEQQKAKDDKKKAQEDLKKANQALKEANRKAHPVLSGFVTGVKIALVMGAGALAGAAGVKLSNSGSNDGIIEGEFVEIEPEEENTVEYSNDSSTEE